MDRSTFKKLKISLQEKSERFFDELDKEDGYPENIEMDAIRLVLSCNADENPDAGGIDVKALVRAISDDSPGVPAEGLKFTYYFLMNIATDEESPHHHTLTQHYIDSFKHMKSCFYL